MTTRAFRVAVKLNSGRGSAGYQYMEADEYEAAEQMTETLDREGWDCHVEYMNSELAAGWQIGDPSHNEHFITDDGTHFGHGDWVWVYGYSGDLMLAQVDFLLEGTWRKFYPGADPMPWLFYVQTKNGHLMVTAKECYDFRPGVTPGVRAEQVAKENGEEYVRYQIGERA